MREHVRSPDRIPTTPAGRAIARPSLPSAIGNRAMAALMTSPANNVEPEEAALREGTELTTPPAAAPAAPAAPVVDPTTRQIPASLQVKSSGAIEGAYGISQYWPVTNYWGDDKMLGEFTQPLAGHAGWKMIGHKFQVVGSFSAVCVPGGGTGRVTFLQQARLTNTKGGTAGPWFDDMQYTDAGGGVHHWDPNAESGTDAGAGPGVRRTIAADKYAYTDPPAISYGPDTNTYRKLEFKIHLKPPAGSPDHELVKEATQEIEVKDGVPKVLQAP